MDQGKTLHGFNGRIGRIDLSSAKISVERPPDDFYKLYMGGRGFIIALLLRELRENVDPLGPDNKLIFALGPLTGFPLSGAGRNSIGAKSPLTGGFGETEVGGFWGSELKKAGFDALIFEGAALSPVYLHVKDGELALRDAAHLWGLDVAAAHRAIHEDLNEKRIRTALIGPAGERLVSYASIINDLSHTAARSGIGAVMGSKKLKGIAVQGHRLPAIADMPALKAIARMMANKYKERTTLWKWGTGSFMVSYNKSGNLPVRNFSKGYFENAEKLMAENIIKQYGIGMHSCNACVMGCKKRVKIEQPLEVNPEYGGPEYETVAALGTNCEIDDIPSLCKAHEICNAAGMDTISAGVTIAFAMECFENGILSKKDTDGVDLKFGNAGAMLQMLKKIVDREGFGDILARGSKAAARIIGKGSDQYAMHVKGQEMSMHEPRLKPGLAIHTAVNAAGADHMTGPQDPHYAKEGFHLDSWNMMDKADAISTSELSPQKVRMLYQTGWIRAVGNIIGLCVFVPYTPEEIKDAIKAVTGWPMSTYRLFKVVERTMALCRIFNLREGFRESDDLLPTRFGTGLKEGAIKGRKLDPEEMKAAKQMYYNMLGWDNAGIPTKARLAELDIEWAERLIPKDLIIS
jgi:aldehyde:ferredoxin oxidoreductase